MELAEQFSVRPTQPVSAESILAKVENVKMRWMDHARGQRRRGWEIYNLLSKGRGEGQFLA